MIDVSGTSCAVIGGTHGMGRAVVDALLDGGAEVIVTGRSADNVAAVRAELADRKGAHVLQADVTNDADTARLGELVADTVGALDFLHVNVGIAEVAPFEEVSAESYDAMFAVNAKGAFFSAQRLSPLMRSGGAIVFTTSVTNQAPSPTMSVYAGTKAAVRAFAEVMASELLPRGIRVNTVSPGFIETPTMGFASASSEERAALMEMGDNLTPMRRHGTVREIADAVLFLGFVATFTTGVELPVNGGLGHVAAAGA
ncbi:SDR family oxidoreductase [Lipingzhangella sp. LS1_29]|uniref:SDR family oxidoreductase n=1 Tax=Lipingzhangella rawalii TaxID=2055835 RepID=A0ABU2H323_9ACTN|nr:SDR family oxidoreductase [Lipingzhangella rawalii]MDS1269703.1 SDR family oxidoreductase [Lipingzhangella rawalii]